MRVTNKLRIGLALLLVLAAVVVGQEMKDQAVGYKGVHWLIAPKPTDPGAKSFALTVVEFRFDKAVASGSGGCATANKSMWGNILDCPITLPASVPGGIVQLSFRCDPPDPLGPCGHTVECPGGVACSEGAIPHLYPTTPNNLPINKPRSLDWWGWTNDGNHATLIFEAYVQ
jgi:hypothetical protein